MKRIDKNTGKPFKHGDVREDGYIFRGYQKKKKKDGYFIENWLSPAGLEAKRLLSVKLAREKRSSPKGRAQSLVAAAQCRANENGGKLTITWQDIAKRIEKGVCEITGLPFDLKPPKGTRHNPYSPSLDRIDSRNKDYSPDNVRVVLTAVNIAIGEYGLEKILPILKGIIKYANARN
jgi:hypothetical protein